MWREEVDRGVVTVDALAAPAGDRDSLDLRRLAIDVQLLTVPGAAQQLVLGEGARQIHLSLRSGALLSGPVRLRYAIEGLHDLEPKLLTLRRLAGLWRLGRMPAELFPRDPRADRWIALLRTIDARQAGASHRDIARALFGHSAVEDWRDGADFLRSRVRRLVRQGEALRDGGYLRLVS